MKDHATDGSVERVRLIHLVLVRAILTLIFCRASQAAGGLDARRAVVEAALVSLSC